LIVRVMTKVFSALSTLLMLFLLIFSCRPGESSVAFFRHWIIDPNPNTGKDCCTDILMLGDIDGDGNLDMVVGAEKAESTGLVWYQYPTWEKHKVASGEFTTDGQAADIDGDGDPDIVIGIFPGGKGEILWFENKSGTEKSAWTRHHVGKGYAHDLVVGDVNGDGKLDIVTCDKKKVTLWEQASPDSWREHIVLERPGEGTSLADIDGDSDQDIVYGGSWLENPGSFETAPWKSHPVSPKWSPDTRVTVADMNKDNRPDVVLSVSEGKGPLSWFEAPNDPKTGIWMEHPIEKGVLEGAHSLQVADFDNDGDPDVITAEMHTSSKKRVILYLNEGESFRPLILARNGSHNMRAGDIDHDGDIDIAGKNYAGPGRVIELWENRTSDPGKWKYISIDTDRPRSEKGKMGLCFTDADRDGFVDVVAGSFLYHSPGGNLQGEWKRVHLPGDIDAYFEVDVDGDKFCDLIGISGDSVTWIEATDGQAMSWRTQPVGKVAKGGTQGYAKANLIPGNKPQLIFTRGKNLYVLEIPVTPDQETWPLHRISIENEEEGLAAGDLDGDGDLDMAAIHGDGHQVVWFENPGSVNRPWKMHAVGGQIDSSQTWLDRVAIADLNGDGKPDIIATEERQDWNGRAHLYWFESPADIMTGAWPRHMVTQLRSVNSMDVADVDRDGDIDIVIAEHTDQKSDGAEDNLTVIYLNRHGGRAWSPGVVERGPHSSHLGARLVDLDNDGVLEIVSIGWSQYRQVHLWKKMTPAPFHAHAH
jgi:hypothetical protein